MVDFYCLLSLFCHDTLYKAWQKVCFLSPRILILDKCCSTGWSRLATLRLLSKVKVRQLSARMKRTATLPFWIWTLGTKLSSTLPGDCERSDRTWTWSCFLTRN